MSEDPRIAALRTAIAADPGNAVLIAMLGDLLLETGDLAGSLAAHERALEAGGLSAHQLVTAINIAMDIDDLPAAGRLIQAAGHIVPAAQLDAVRNRLVSVLAGTAEEVSGVGIQQSQVPPDEDETRDDHRGLDLEFASDTEMGFSRVAGNSEAKAAISRAVILPFQRPDLYAAYGRRAGGGALLYGPPGCGKTLLARATAAECGLPFLRIRPEEILAPYRGEAERLLAAAFQTARDRAPCVLFLDELDALAYTRSRQSIDGGRALVTVLLTELDGLESRNDGMLVLAATNTPWDIDDALLRPGRFDRLVWVPPPDTATRAAVLGAMLAARGADGVDVTPLAQATALFSGADLAALVEQAVDLAIDESVAAGTTIPLRHEHLARALDGARATTVDWLLAVRNHVEFANVSGRYDDVARYLAGRDVRKRLSR